MRVHKSISLLGMAMVFAALLIQPVSVQAQCNITSTTSGSFTTSMAGMVYNNIYVSKYFSVGYTCSLSMSNNVEFCIPGGTQNTTVLIATALSSLTNPSCGWMCACDTVNPVTIDSSDGLPVELMDFSIEESE